MKLFKTVTTQQLHDLSKLNETEISFCGTVIDVRTGQTQKGNSFAILKIKDDAGECEIPLFGEDYIKYSKFAHKGSDIYVTARVQPKEWNSAEIELKILSIRFENDLNFAYNEERKLGFVDAQGEIVIPFEYDSGYLCRLKDGRYFISVQKNEKWGLIDIHNNIKIPFEYEEFTGLLYTVCIFTEDENKNRVEKEMCIFWVQKDGKSGFVDGEGNVLLSCEYSWIDVVCRNSKLYFLTGKGKFVRKPRKIEEGIVVSMRDAFEFEEEIEFCEGYIID